MLIGVGRGGIGRGKKGEELFYLAAMPYNLGKSRIVNGNSQRRHPG